MLTRRGKAAITAAVVFVVAGRILGVTELFGIAAALAVVVVVGVLRVRGSKARLALSARLSPEVIQAGDPAVLEVFAENNGSGLTPQDRLQIIPSGGGRHRVLVPRLAPGERATIAIGLDSTRRGRHGISGYEAALGDGLGLAHRRLVTTGTIGYLVRPRTEDLPNTLPLSAGREGRDNTRSAAERILTGASTLRPYVAGDDLRRIHWPTTARVGDLIVREGGDPDTASHLGTTIVLGTRRGEGARFERAVEVAASVVAAAAREGMVRLVTTGGFDSGLDGTDGHVDAINLELATVQASLPPARPTRRRRSSRIAAGAPGGTALEEFGDGPSDEDNYVLELIASKTEKGTSTLVVVEGAPSLAEAEVSRATLSSLPVAIGAVLAILVGTDTAGIERVGRSEVAVYLPPDRPMRDIWNTPMDLPIGEVRLLDVASEVAS